MSLFDEVLDLFGWVPPARSPPKPSARPAPAAHPQPAPSPAPVPEPRAAAAPAPQPKAEPAAARPRSARPAHAGRTEAETLAVIGSVTPQFHRVVYTRNRRIMASAANRGRDLRLNVAFAEAPREVLAAVARLFTGRDARTRNRAKEVVRQFINAIPPAPGAPTRRPRTRQVQPGDERHLERLRDEFRRVNAEHFGGALPEVPLFLSGQMRRRNGHFCSNPLEIVISRRLCTHAEAGQAEHTLRHEMIHLWQHAEGARPDHGPAFRAWARRLDVHPRATRPVTWKNQRREG